MNTKLIFVLAAMIALSSVNAQVPALTSLSSKIESLSSSATAPQRSPLISSASSAYSRISSQINRSSQAAGGGGGVISSGVVTSTVVNSNGAGDGASSTPTQTVDGAGGAQTSEGAGGAHTTEPLSTLTSTATHISASETAASGAHSLFNSDSMMIQVTALAALFVASFVAMLA